MVRGEIPARVTAAAAEGKGGGRKRKRKTTKATAAAAAAAAASSSAFEEGTASVYDCHLPSLMAFKHIPIPKLTVPLGLDGRGRRV